MSKKEYRPQQPRQPEQTQPLHGGAAGETIFAPAEHKGSDTARLIPAIEKSIQRLSQPDGEEADDFDSASRRVLHGLYSLELRREILQQFTKPADDAEVDHILEMRRSDRELTGRGSESAHWVLHEGRVPKEAEGHYVGGYVQALQDLLKIMGARRQAEQEKKP